MSEAGEKVVAVRVLGIPGCRNAEKAHALILNEAKAMHLSLSIDRVEVSGQEQAARERMSGSPTVLINGLDIDPALREAGKYGTS